MKPSIHTSVNSPFEGHRHSEDALDFEKTLDDTERSILRERGIDQRAAEQLLDHREALGVVRFPRTAEYLVKHFELREGRVLEKKRFTEHGKEWYEYHRPRDPDILFAKPRILSPRLLREVSFVLDSEGYLSDDACLFIQPAATTSREFVELQKALRHVLQEPQSVTAILRYCLAFLNSPLA